MKKSGDKNKDPLHYLKEKGYEVSDSHNVAGELLRLISLNQQDIAIYLEKSKLVKVNYELTNGITPRDYRSFFDTIINNGMHYKINQSQDEERKQENIIKQINKNK